MRADRRCPSVIEGDHSKTSFIAFHSCFRWIRQPWTFLQEKGSWFPVRALAYFRYLQLSGVYSPRDGMHVHEEG